MADNALQKVTVEVMGRKYPITTKLAPEDIQQLATYVDETFRSATENASGTDTVGIGVLAALIIADQYFQARNSHSQTAKNLSVKDLTEQIEAIERMVDQALETASLAPGNDEKPGEIT